MILPLVRWGGVAMACSFSKDNCLCFLNGVLHGTRLLDI